MNEFFVGYLPSAPPGIRRRVRIAVAVFALLGLAGAVLFATSQNDFAKSYFDFGKPREFSGRLSLEPYPLLQSASSAEPFLVVAPGKFGADSLVSGAAGRNVRLQGTLIHRAEGQMLEIVPGSAVETPGSLPPAAAPESRDLGEVRLLGEIVDTKCFLGVMNPGEGRVHRECAVRCLSGGIPPALVTRGIDGVSRIVLLTDPHALPLPLSSFQDVVAQPVAISGHLSLRNAIYYLQVSPRSIERLP